MRIGDRVQYSARGLEWLHYRQREGAVISSSLRHCRVRWDGRKTPVTYHSIFIERIPEEPLPEHIAKRFAHIEITDD